MGKKVEYKNEPKETSDGSTNVDIEEEPVELGSKLHIQHISAEDETNAFTYLRIGYVKNGKHHWWVEQKSPSAGTLYWMSDPKVLTGGMALVIRFNGTISGDKLAAYLDGFRERVSSSPGAAVE